MSATRDYHVTYRRAEYIEQTALDWRRLLGNSTLPYFDIVAFVENFLLPHWLKKGRLEIVLFDAQEGEDLAYVQFKPSLTLHVDREVWRLAKLGEPKARFIVAHEVGHILLHEKDVQHFSSDPSTWIKFTNEENEYSAEWQANVFASYFLIPRSVMNSFETIRELIERTSVNERFVLERHPEAGTLTVRRAVRESGLCTTCGNFTVTSDGICKSKSCTPDERGARRQIGK